MGVKFTTISFIFFCAIAIYPSTTTCAHDPCASQPDDSDLTVIPIYGKCSPFQSDPNSWLNTIINMASNDPERIEYLSSLMVLRKRKPVNKAPIASGQAFNIGSYVVRVRLGTPGQLMFMTVMDGMDDESPPAKAEAQVRRPLRIPKSKAKGFTVNAISKSMTPLTKSLNWGWGNYFNSRVARKSSSTLERIVTDGEIRKRKYSPIAKKRRTWAMTLRSLSG
ncbi:aspartyl protease AED3-like [Sesbania bispinosa]|nr:aspartyl protease AED3-like [Sesbania bispinosa]